MAALAASANVTTSANMTAAVTDPAAVTATPNMTATSTMAAPRAVTAPTAVTAVNAPTAVIVSVMMMSVMMAPVMMAPVMIVPVMMMSVMIAPVMMPTHPMDLLDALRDSCRSRQIFRCHRHGGSFTQAESHYADHRGRCESEFDFLYHLSIPFRRLLHHCAASRRPTKAGSMWRH